MASQLPEPLNQHYVIIDGRRFPPKQVLAAVTGLDRADFTSHQARRVLNRVGFLAGRCSVGDARSEPLSGAGPFGGSQAEALRPFIGQWVATRGDDVLVAADSPARIVEWLTRHGQRAESMFRVPADETSAGGAAPA